MRTLPTAGSIGVVNYGSVNVRLSRVVYAALRRAGLASRDRHLFWDTPVPIEHTFECTYPTLMASAVSISRSGAPSACRSAGRFRGGGDVLGRLSDARASWVLHKLDRIAYRVPRLADYILSV